MNGAMQRLELEEEGRSLDEGQQSNKANLSSERDTSSCEKEGDLMTVSQSSSQNSKQSRRVSFGQSLALEDLKTPGNLKSSVGSSLPSTDPDDASYCSDQDLRDSTSKVFTWNYLDGSGRLSSHVDTAWTVDGTEVGRDLMEFRDRVVRENGALTKPYEKL
ncbi:hypothetical protein EDD21DRAFT_359837 [Dissophora ornata]|nr:hypothetical protein EDD21DRAFT_359837 [Dissophora ornata]